MGLEYLGDGDDYDLLEEDRWKDDRMEAEHFRLQASRRYELALMAERLEEMRGSLTWNYLMARWVVYAPQGTRDATGCCHTIDTTGDDQCEAVARVHAQWVAAGRPGWPKPEPHDV